MSARTLLAVAQAELRHGRTARAWLVRLLAVALVVGSYGVLAAMHASHSGALGTFAGAYAPRFAVAALGGVWLYLLMVAAVFLAFDARDGRERIVDVLDAKPLSNFALLGGRLLAVVATVYLPLLAALGLIEAFGLLCAYLTSEVATQALGWRIGVPVEPVSLGVFLLVDAVPALALTVAATLCLSCVLRSRALTVCAALALIGLHVWASGSVPVHLLPAVSLVAAQGHAASDMLPAFPSHLVLAQRLCVLLLALALLHWAAARHPRRDIVVHVGSRRLLPAGMMLVAGLGILSIGREAARELGQRERWLGAHRAAAAQQAVDIARIEGEVHIDPGVSLTLDVDVGLEFAHAESAAAPPSNVVLSFNPGLRIAALRIADQPASFTHADGLLVIDLPPALGFEAATTLRLRAQGVPDAAFAYLDSAADHRRGTAANPLLLLGTTAALFERNYVALMPAVHWLPSVGANLHNPKTDYFDLDIIVSVPAAWRVAGLGATAADGATFHVRPEAPVPAFALFAAPFERRAITVGDVTFELLLHPRHGRNAAFFADAVEGEYGIAERIAELLDRAAADGLPYPYRALHAVEVPARLRGYGGGWLLDAVMAQPGLLLLRESGFPMSRFESPFHGPSFRTWLDHSPVGRKRVVLDSYFVWERSGGSSVNTARNLFDFQLSAAGPGAGAINYLCRELVVRLLWPGKRIVQTREVFHNEFSAHAFDKPPSFGMGTGALFGNLLAGRGPGEFLATANRPSVWTRLGDTPLARLGREPRADAGALALKASALATAIFDAYGREKAAALLAELRRRHAGGNFTAAELESAASSLGMPLRPLLGDWLRATALPGFLASEAQVVRIDDEGKPRYQTRVHVRNGEAAPGLARLTYEIEVPGSEYPTQRHTEPVRINGEAAVELGFVTEQPPNSVWLTPYLSLNRRMFPLVLDVDGIRGDHGGSVPFSGSRPSTWRPPSNGHIVVDDLDPGFEAFQADPGQDVRLGGRPPVASIDLDHGLPEHSGFGFQSWWSRDELPTSYGKYRRTSARTAGDDGLGVFTATLPNGGRWHIDYHIPDLQQRSMTAAFGGRYDIHGSYRLTLVTGDRRIPVEFDGAAVPSGWHPLGAFDLDAGIVRVMVRNGAAEKTVVADAVRFRPVQQAAD